jgi:outer membrane protein TolC
VSGRTTGRRRSRCPPWQAPSPDASASPQSLANWWEQLADPQLSALVADALAANPDLDAARAALRAARASRDAAAAQRAPVSALAVASPAAPPSAASARSTTPASTPPGSSTSSAACAAPSKRLTPIAPRRWPTCATRVSLVAEVALNYIDLRAAQMRLAIARANLASQTETLQITQWRSQAGLASALDVEQARSNRESTRAQIPTLDTGRAAAEHRLAVLAGRAPGSLHDVLAVADGARGGLLPGCRPASR